MSVLPAPPGCDHSVPECGICKMLREEDGTAMTIPVALIEEANAQDEPTRSMWLETLAEGAVLEAGQLYEALGRDGLDLTLFVERSLIYPPCWVGNDVAEWYARGAALREMPYPEYLRTPEWAEQRRRALKRAGGRCQGCDTPENLEVHHRTYERRGEEEPGDLTVLCAGCHTAVHLVADGRRGKVRSESRRTRV